MIRIDALTSGRNIPSSRFRVRQYVEPLREQNILVRERIPLVSAHARLPGWPAGWSHKPVLPLYAAWVGMKVAARTPLLWGARQADMVWLERCMVPGLYTLESWLKKPLILDVDDAVWLGSRRARDAAVRLARQAQCVLAGNAFLADWYSAYNPNVRIVPTAVDGNVFRPPSETASGSGRFVVGWMGSYSNLPFLLAIEPAIRTFLDRHHDAEWLIISDRRPALSSFQQVRFERWTERREVGALQEMSVGLMPLEDCDWARGKCSFKMLQYLACARPVVASPVGMNAELFAKGSIGYPARSLENWIDALDALYADGVQRRRMGNVGREIVLQHYDTRRVASVLTDCFMQFAPSPS